MSLHANRILATPALPRSPAPSDVIAPLTFVADGASRPQVLTAALKGGTSEYVGNYATHSVPIRDARPLAGALSVEREGFELHGHSSAVEDFYDDEKVRTIYYPEIERLLAKATGAREVIVFDHTWRSDAGGSGGLRKPAGVVHNDYTSVSGPRRIRELLAAEQLARLGDAPFAQINAWRPIRGTVQRSPLAFADASSVAPGNLVTTPMIYPDRSGEIYQLAHDQSQRWFYFPDMTPDELVLIKGYDSRQGHARFTPHSAFEHPATRAGAAARESLELRTFAFF